jgi:hypothetical protein
LRLAARLNPQLAAEYVAVEERIGHTFKAGRSIAAIVAAAAEEGDQPAPERVEQMDLFACV